MNLNIDALSNYKILISYYILIIIPTSFSKKIYHTNFIYLLLTKIKYLLFLYKNEKKEVKVYSNSTLKHTISRVPQAIFLFGNGNNLHVEYTYKIFKSMLCVIDTLINLLSSWLSVKLYYVQTKSIESFGPHPIFLIVSDSLLLLLSLLKNSAWLWVFRGNELRNFSKESLMR